MTEKFFNEGDWWRRDGAFRLLHDINPLRLRLAGEAAGGLAGKRILDFGCGGGIFAEAAARAGAKVVGCDISPGAIRIAKEHAAQNNVAVEYRVGGVDLSEAGQYDALSCFEMLEHAEDPAQIVADAAAMLKPGGVAVFSTINRTLRAFALMIAGLEYALKILPAGTHEYRKFVAPRELAGMCADCGLSVRRVAGMRYSFFGRAYFLREDEAAVNYFLTAARRE
ncbi:MAG: bifunctional 2-polyprenyl-6-hydroxyphenol methylase/3-demethylubiquinol 3-O-methyltransferase UbiG [Gammaproteobacteria bacterium]